jgi:DNA polymerase-4
MNAFFASIEEQINPFLKGKPVVVCGNPKGRTAVASASYEARRYGVEAGMSLHEVFRRCPQVYLVSGDLEKYLDISKRIFAKLYEYTPLVEIYSIDEAFLDITFTHHLFKGAVNIAHRIKSWMAKEYKLTCSIGIGPTKMIAKLASSLKKPDGLVILRAKDIPKLFKKLPVKSLWGIGEKTAQYLYRLGIHTCEELGSYPVEALISRFGKMGRVLKEMGLGLWDAPLASSFKEQVVKSMGHSHTLDFDTDDLESIKRVIFYLSEEVAKRLRKEGYSGRTVCLTLRYSDFFTFGRHLTTNFYMNQGYDIYKVALLILEKIPLSQKIRMVGVSVSNLLRDFSQTPLFPKENKRIRASEVVDYINQKYGEFTIMPATLLPLPRKKKMGKLKELKL